MRSVGRFDPIEATEEERLDQEMEQEIEDQRNDLKKYISNVDNLLGKKRANEVYRNMIYVLAENIK